MAENSGIQWTDHTFNPWWGCAKVSAGCANCYAEDVAVRFAGEKLWGTDKSRRPASENVWGDPLRWNRKAEKAGRRAVVFAASMGDIFEGRSDLDPLRERLWGVILDTPWLSWIILSKRPENFGRMLPREVAGRICLGVSVENQATADLRIPLLLQTTAACRIVSAEPLLGPVDFYMVSDAMPTEGHPWANGPILGGIDGVICGGESSPNARPMHPDWARSLRDQCADAGVPFFFKQWGEWADEMHPAAPDCFANKRLDDRFVTIQRDAEGFAVDYTGEYMVWVGKKRAGRLLDGREHNEMPERLRLNGPATGGGE